MAFTSLFNNLLTHDLLNTKYFYQMLGFYIEEEYTNEKTLCIKLMENVYIMFLTQDILESFTKNKYKKHHFDNQIISLFVKNILEVESYKDKLENLLKHHYEAVESEYMYYIRFKDNNGYIIEISCYK